MFQHWFNCFMISVCLFHNMPIYSSAYLVCRVAGHSVCRGADGTVWSVDDNVAAGVVFDTEPSPGVCLVSPGVDVKPATNITNLLSREREYLLSCHANSRLVSVYNLHIELSCAG